MRKIQIFRMCALAVALMSTTGAWADVLIPAFEQSNPFSQDYPRECGGIVWGDYDNDGKPDALVFGGEWNGSTNPLLYKNNGNGTFTDVTVAVFGAAFAKPLYLGSVVWLDYNKDGALDLIVAGRRGTDGSDPVLTEVYKNTGSTGGYTLAVDAAMVLPNIMSGGGGGTGRFIAVADFDGDTYPDVALLGQTPEASYFFGLYKNNGGTSFSKVTNPVAGGADFIQLAVGSVAWGDYNADGHPDILFQGIFNDGGDKRRTGIYKNNGDNTFTEILLSAHFNSGEAAWIDYDKDGKLDVFATGSGGMNGDWDGWWNGALYHNDGGDVFTAATGYGLPASCESSLAVGDINNDGYDDIVIIGQNQSPNYAIFYNNGGDGTFTPDNFNTQPVKYDVTKGMAALVDYNGDGWLDLSIAGNYVIPQLFTNAKRQAGTAAVEELPAPAAVTKVTYERRAITGMINGVGDGGGAIWGDYNNDGNIDVFIWGLDANGDGMPSSNLYKNNGDGTFTNVTTSILGSSFPILAYAAAAWLDYNNDERLDLIISGATSKSGDVYSKFATKVYMNLGAAGSYALNEEQTILIDPYDTEKKGGCARNLAVADYNNDGYQDILVMMRYTDEDLDGTSRRFEIWKNLNGEAFAKVESADAGIISTNGGGIAWGDYDKDGDMDILFSGYRNDDYKVEGNNYVSGVLTNNGSGVFTEINLRVDGADYDHPDDGKQIFGTETGEVLWADFDGDGYLDAIVTGQGPGAYAYDPEIGKYKTRGWDFWNAAVFKYDPATKTFGTGRPRERETGLRGSAEGSYTSCDWNDDGLPDFVVTGQSRDDRTAAKPWIGATISYLTSNGICDADVTGTEDFRYGTASFVDLGNGGKLDLFVTGTHGTALFYNTSSIVPATPAVPTGLTATPGANGEITISWAASAIPTMRYNVVLSKPETQYKNFVISQIPINAATGAPKVSLDHAPLLTTNTYTLKGIPSGEYTVGVQAIGINGKASALATTTATVGSSGSNAAAKHLLGNVTAYKHGSAIVVTTDITAEAELTVYNLNGAKVWSKTGVFAGDTEINGLQQGAIYLVVIRVGNAQEVRKVLL